MPDGGLSPDQIRDISVAVYSARLGGEREVAGFIAAHQGCKGGGEAYLRRCAGAFDVLTRTYLVVLGLAPDK